VGLAIKTRLGVRLGKDFPIIAFGPLAQPVTIFFTACISCAASSTLNPEEPMNMSRLSFRLPTNELIL
jgi:hypothetical protein